jgi:predicted PurR-regulated permease PerM
MTERRSVEFSVRTVVRLLVILFAAYALFRVFQQSRAVITWILIAVLLALALDPFVTWIERRVRLRRGAAIGVAYLVLVLALAGIGLAFVPTLVDEVRGLVDATPDYIEDVTKGRGRLGFLETRFHLVEKVRAQIEEGGVGRVLGLSGKALEVTRSVVTIVAATVTILFLTAFMLLEGRMWTERFYSLMPESSRDRWRGVGNDIHRTVSGYVTGNLLISLIAGVSATAVLLIMGVPFAVALGLLVAILDLIPLAGATVAGIVVVSVSFIHSIPAGVVLLVFVIVYQQLENHFLQPVVYGRTVQLSPLVVLIAVLVGASVAGIVGALAAIPVAGSIQVVVRDVLARRQEAQAAAATDTA